MEGKRYIRCLKCNEDSKIEPNNYKKIKENKEFVEKHKMCSMLTLLNDKQPEQKSYYKTNKTGERIK